MKCSRILFSILLAAFFVVSASAQVRLTEFMASNSKTLADENGDYSDWIEIQNTAATNVNLLNWSLTDSAGNPAKWLFPATNIAAGSYLIVFASGKDRRVAGQPLHTSFKLSADGEYLALVRPDGLIATEISPAFPPQYPDVAYGIGMQVSSFALVASNATMRYRIPTSSADDATWTQVGFNDTGWRTGTNGIGYETGIYDPAEQAFSQQVLQTQPVAYWRLNETNGPAADNLSSAGVALQAGYLGGTLPGQPGPRPPQFGMFETNNNAPFFNGTNAYVGGPYQLLSGLTAFTLAGWINPAGVQAARSGLFGQNNVAELGFDTPTTILLYTTAGSVSFAYPYPTNQWHYLMAVANPNRLALYLDGSLMASLAVSATTFDDSGNFFNIGGGGVFDDTDNYFLGGIDEVAVWNRDLSTNEIASLAATNAAQVNYTNYLKTDVNSQMYGSNSTAYVRLPFNVTSTNGVNRLQLLMRFDDGFAAYLNGHPIFSTNAPGAPAWNSAATQRHADGDAVQWINYDVSAALPYLQNGANVLAIQALNINATNTDFLMQAQLLAQSVTDTTAGWRFFTGPTPGGPNGISTADMGPILSGAGHLPSLPPVSTALVVTSHVAQAFGSISNVTLHYRVMFNSEVALIMNDGGTNGDAVSGDGNWTGVIPAGVATAGQMIRYYITAVDTAGNVSRWPIYPDAANSQQYFGTVVTGTNIQSLLPVVQMFIQNTNAADTTAGTAASLFYLNEFYDNLNISLHGQSSASWAKKSHNLDFPADHQFLYQPGGVREGHVIFLSDYSSKSRMSTTLAYKTVVQSGSAGFFSFPIRTHLNGTFWGLEDMVERGDDLFLTRIGRDPNGALYKMYNDLSSASGNEKKTRTSEGTGDLTGLITNLDESRPLATREAYAYDHLDLPQTASYFAAMALVSSQDLGHKNYYLYHDNDGTGEWAIFPWDLDLTFGRNWVSSYGGSNYFNDTMFTTNGLNFYPGAQIQSKPSNRLFDLFFGSADFQQMYLRRLRSLMDNLLTPASAPTNYIESQIRQAENLIDPTNIVPSDAGLDFAKWGPKWGNTNWSVMRTAAEQIVAGYLPGRRNFLYTSNTATLNGSLIPAAQPAGATVSIASSDYSPISGKVNEQYVELRNTNAYAVDVSGWRLTGAIGCTLRAGTVIPAGKSLYLSPDVNAFRARTNGVGGGQRCYVQGPFAGFLSQRGNSALILQNDHGALVSKNGFAGGSSANNFVAGNLAVLRVGDGAETLGSHGNSVYIDQFTTNGTPMGNIPIPDNAANALIISGSASSEGALIRSADGRLLVLAGYQMPLTNAALLSTSLANADATNAPRAVGVVDVSGNFALVGVTTNQFSQNNMRSGATDGRGRYWGAGGVSGTFYFGNGPTNTLQTTVKNTIVLQDLGGDLYFSTAKTINGLWKISGTPVTGGLTPANLISSGSSSSPYAFVFNPGFTSVYIADDTVTGKGGIQRWNLAGGNWTLAYAFTGLTNIGARGVAADFSGVNPVLYATTAEGMANRLVSLTDTGATAMVATLATAGINQLFRGVTFAPDATIAPQFFNAVKGSNGMTVTFTTLINRNYTLAFTTDLANPNWIMLTNLTTTMPVLTLTDPAMSAGTNRFYRLILNP